LSNHFGKDVFTNTFVNGFEKDILIVENMWYNELEKSEFAEVLMNRVKVIEFIQNEFGVEGEQLWLTFPDYVVFRNQKNKKWFAIIMDIEKSKLGLDGEGRVDIIDLRCDNILIGSLIRNKGYLPAYHMNKKNWITVLLDDSVNDNELKDLIHFSYEIIKTKK